MPLYIYTHTYVYKYTCMYHMIYIYTYEYSYNIYVGASIREPTWRAESLRMSRYRSWGQSGFLLPTRPGLLRKAFLPRKRRGDQYLWYVFCQSPEKHSYQGRGGQLITSNICFVGVSREKGCESQRSWLLNSPPHRNLPVGIVITNHPSVKGAHHKVLVCLKRSNERRVHSALVHKNCLDSFDGVTLIA